MTNISTDQLRAFIERIEKMEAEKNDIAIDIREIYAEAKGQGFDPKVMREVIRRRKKAENEQQEFDFVLDTYLHALGMDKG